MPAETGGQLAVKPKRKKPSSGEAGDGLFAFTLRSQVSELEALCRRLEEIGARLHLSRRCLFEINLVLDELFTNIVSYGFKDDREHTIAISLKAEGDFLEVAVEDDGVPFNPVRRKDPELPTAIEDCQIGGLGIHLIKNLVQEPVYCRRGKRNVLTFKKRIERI
jgi:anti-sigma regulatory factor (Ser/Thr protein kinase)